MIILVSSSYSANCPPGWKICWTGSYQFGEWIASTWSETSPWTAWQSVIPVWIPSPIAGKDDYAYAALSLQYFRTRTEDRDGKDQWEQKDCDDGIYTTFWGIVLPAKYARTAKEIRHIIRISEQDVSDPDNIVTVREFNFSDTTTPSFGFKTLVSHQEPASAQCADED
jgi:hypothetical protein